MSAPTAPPQGSAQPNHTTAGGASPASGKVNWHSLRSPAHHPPTLFLSCLACGRLKWARRHRLSRLQPSPTAPRLEVPALLQASPSLGQSQAQAPTSTMKTIPQLPILNSIGQGIAWARLEQIWFGATTWMLGDRIIEYPKSNLTPQPFSDSPELNHIVFFKETKRSETQISKIELGRKVNSRRIDDQPHHHLGPEP